MKSLKRMTALVLVLAMAAALFSGLALTANAESYPYNTGSRHTLCTSLSTQATTYYSDNKIVWEELCTLPGSSTGSSLKAMDSQLYQTLHDLMKGTLKNLGTYSGLTSLWPYTDTAEGQANNVQLFYSDITGSSYNREHVWPKSRASYYQTNGGADVQHLRPTNSGVNSTRGNYTMGNVRDVCSTYSTYKNSVGDVVLYYNSSYGTAFNGELPGLVEVNDNIKGDVARVLLYVYVTWEQPNLFENVSHDDLPEMDKDDSQNNGLRVIESLDTLLDWMESDPVDTWEMGRNDVSQLIQGNRNVFIDYPELAWMLFNEPLPTDYDTPSGYAKENGTASEYAITALSSDEAWGTVSLSGKSVIATPAEGYTVTGYTLSPEDAATVTRVGNIFNLTHISGDCTITIQFAEKSAATVRFAVPAGVTASSAQIPSYLGDIITLPTVEGTPSADDGKDYKFLGWTDEPVTDETDLTALNVYAAGSEYTVPGSTTLYALYSHVVSGGSTLSGEFVLVTEDPGDWSGSYVFSTEFGETMNNTAAGSYMETSYLTLDGSVIRTSDSSVIWTVSRLDDGTYTIQDSDGKYLSCFGSKKVTTVDEADSTTSWTLGVSSIVPSTASYGALQFNKSAPRFTTYTSTQTAIGLYAASTGTLHYTTLDGTAADDCTDGHDWGEWVETKAATCTEQGEETRTCGRCGETETRKTDALGHDWDEGKVTKEATETATGEKTYTCNRCGETKTEELPKAECPSAKFTDVDTSKWYHEGVDFAVSNGYIRGITDTTFEPNTPMNRGMLVTILYRVAGEPDVADTSIPFTDVAEGRYFTNAVKWAYSNNIVTGVTETTFEPQTPVTREQLATILYRYADAEEVEEDLLKDFPDSASVHKYAQKAMNWAVSAGLITGNKADGVVYLDPAGSATRAQIAVILMRYLTTIA